MISNRTFPWFSPGEYVSAASHSYTRPKCSMRKLIKQAKLPNHGRIRFVHKKSDRNNCMLTKIDGGYEDRLGNKWIKPKGLIIGDFHWDVQLSEHGKKNLKWLSKSGEHVNVTPNGRVPH